MPSLQIQVECPVHRSFRVAQLAGMFDMPLAEKSKQVFCVERPPLEDDWNIGLILGPSGSGKSTIARHLFGENLYRGGDWLADRAVVDCFGERPIKEITRYLTAVGFSSPPSWLKPYAVLSNGEKFRCDLAKALLSRGQRTEDGGQEAEGKKNNFQKIADESLEGCLNESNPESPSLSSVLRPLSSSLTVFDEYTSVVDRNVAKVASAAIAKGIKSGRMPGRFVAVSCHYDIAEWLEPDWVLDMANGAVSRRSLRRPPIELRIVRSDARAWPLFARHHYLRGDLPKSVRCFLAVWNDEPVAFCAVMSLMGFVGRRRVCRIVTLPDYQGIGIGSAFLEAVGEIHREQHLRLNITTSHPSMIGHCGHSKKWKTVNVMKNGGSPQTLNGRKCRSSAGRSVVSFEYVGESRVQKR